MSGVEAVDQESTALPGEADSVFSAVASGVLGRTNRQFPSVWLSLSLPHDSDHLDGLVEAALGSNAPIDVTSQPGLWGAKLRGHSPTLVAIGASDFERSTEEAHSCDLVQGHLIGLLSCLGRETIDIFFLRVRGPLEEFQIAGALQALELARQEGHIRYIGLCCDGPSLPVLGTWQFHDAFEVLLVERNHYRREAYQTLAPLAKERRVGVVTSRPLNWGYGLPFVAMPDLWRLRNLTQSFYGLTLAQAVIANLAADHPVLVGVRTAEEVRQAVSATEKPLPTGLDAMLQPFIEAFEGEDLWKSLIVSENPILRSAAEARLSEIKRGGTLP